MYDNTSYLYGTGRRKSSIARVRVYKGTGKIIINGNNEISNCRLYICNYWRGVQIDGHWLF